MTTFIKTKFKISDVQKNNDNYRLAANMYYRITYNTKLIVLRNIIPKFVMFDMDKLTIWY